MNKYFFHMIVIATLAQSIIRPEWYTGIEFIVSVVALIVYELFSTQESAVSKKEFEEMKTAVGNLGGQIKTTSTKLSGLRMHIGIKD